MASWSHAKRMPKPIAFPPTFADHVRDLFLYLHKTMAAGPEKIPGGTQESPSPANRLERDHFFNLPLDHHARMEALARLALFIQNAQKEGDPDGVIRGAD